MRRLTLPHTTAVLFFLHSWMYDESYFWEDFIWWLHCPWGFLFMAVLDFSPLLLPDAVLLLTTPPSYRVAVLTGVRARQAEVGEADAGAAGAESAAMVMAASAGLLAEAQQVAAAAAAAAVSAAGAAVGRSRKRSRDAPADARVLTFWARARKQPRKMGSLLAAAAAAAAWSAAARYRSAYSASHDATDAVDCLRPRRRTLWGASRRTHADASPDPYSGWAAQQAAPSSGVSARVRRLARRNSRTSIGEGAAGGSSSRSAATASLGGESSTATSMAASVDCLMDTATSGDVFAFGKAASAGGRSGKPLQRLAEGGAGPVRKAARVVVGGFAAGSPSVGDSWLQLRRRRPHTRSTPAS